MLRGFAILSVACLFVFGCTKKTDKPQPISPFLNILSIDGACLNLQAIVSQVGQPGFDFSGFAYTRKFDAADGSRSIMPSYLDSLTAASFRAGPIRFRGLPELRGLEQHDCTEVTIPFTKDIKAKYKIYNFSLNRLEMHLDQTQLTQDLSVLPAQQTARLAEFPMVKEYAIYLPSNLKIEMRTEYTTIPNPCHKAPSIAVREEVVYNWAPSGQQPETSARIERAYWNKIRGLAGQPSDEPTSPETPAPAPPPDAAAENGPNASPPSPSEFINLDLAGQDTLVHTLRSSLNELCL